MKKRCFVVLLIVVVVMLLTGCKALRIDNDSATLSVTTSNGEAYLLQSFNGTGKAISGRDISLKNKFEYTLKKGETANLIFKCDSCGNEQTYEINMPWAKTICCDCPVKMDEDGNSKEYVSVTFSYEN